MRRWLTRFRQTRGVPFLTMLACLGLLGATPSPNSAEPAGLPQQLTIAAEPDVVSLAQHLRQVGAKMYGAYWCPYCHRQQDLFGSAFSYISYIECDPRGKNAQPQLCRDAEITAFPTWEINGQFFQGVRSLKELARLSGYTGSQNF